LKQVTLNYKTNELRLLDVPAPVVQPKHVLVRTAFSAVSVGTEGMKVTRAAKGLLAMAKERPDQVRQLMRTVQREGVSAAYRKAMNKLDVPNALGYSLSGIVEAVGEGVTDLRVGDRVACAGEGIAAHAEVVLVPKNLCVKVPDEVPLHQAAFATIGAIAMQGVRQAAPTIGETIGVIGLGVLGQIAAQILRAGGCQVVGIDVDPQKCDLAVRHGALAAFPRSAEHLERDVMAATNGRGLDAVLVTAATSSSDPVQLGITLCRDRGTLVVLGIVGIEVPFEKAVKKELQIRLSRSYGPGRYDPTYEVHGVDYPLGYVRWTEQRNMESFLGLAARGAIQLDSIITDRLPFEQAADAYEKVKNRGSSHVLGVVFEYDQSSRASARVVLNAAAPRPAGESVRVGVIGAGNFARGTLLPQLKAMTGVELRGVANATGLSARFTADKFGFNYCTADPQEVLGDADVDLVVIATRHDTHASLAVEAMRRGKAVFVEKPLALTREELSQIIEAQRETGARLMVGFNRRFAPATDAVMKLIRGRREPIVVHYRVNAGLLPADHWLQDPLLGGGRMIGEGCHFIDWMRALVGSPIRTVSAVVSGNAGTYRDDNVIANFTFEDGSIGSLTYTGNGNSGMAKERAEVFCDGTSIVLDDYRSVTAFVKERSDAAWTGKQDKGHAAEMQLLIDAVRGGKELPIAFEEVAEVTDATFGVLESMRSGLQIDLRRDAEPSE